MKRTKPDLKVVTQKTVEDKILDEALDEFFHKDPISNVEISPLLSSNVSPVGEEDLLTPHSMQDVNESPVLTSPSAKSVENDADKNDHSDIDGESLIGTVENTNRNDDLVHSVMSPFPLLGALDTTIGRFVKSATNSVMLYYAATTLSSNICYYAFGQCSQMGQIALDMSIATLATVAYLKLNRDNSVKLDTRITNISLPNLQIDPKLFKEVVGDVKPLLFKLESEVQKNKQISLRNNLQLVHSLTHQLLPIHVIDSMRANVEKEAFVLEVKKVIDMVETRKESDSMFDDTRIKAAINSWQKAHTVLTQPRQELEAMKPALQMAARF